MIKDENGRFVESPVHGWFGLSYCSYLVVPRLALQEMPLDWQQRFVSLMNEAADLLTTPSYEVRRRDESGKFVHDPWRNYRRGTVAEAVAEDERIADGQS